MLDRLTQIVVRAGPVGTGPSLFLPGGGGEQIVTHDLGRAPSSSASRNLGGSVDTSTAAAWVLTQQISPRTQVRVAAIDAAGTVLNQYCHTQKVDRDHPPSAPWAVPLAGPDGFRLIAFDFDAKRGAASTDAARLSALLNQLSIPHLICRSGPSDGRHVWFATADPVEPELVGTMARLAAGLLSSLDITPLRNFATGCVRPPGSPHRDGGRSEPLIGNLECLRRPQIGSAEVRRLVAVLAASVNRGSSHATIPTPATAIAIDSDGHPYLPGTRRPLPAASTLALRRPVVGDASVALNTVLLGAASAHWRLNDVAAVVEDSPGMEHVRTRSGTGIRTSRTAAQRAEVLARQWRYAVRYIANHPRRPGLDQSFDQRAGYLADIVRTAQARADAAVGRWQDRGGPSDRRVLDCLHLLALTAVAIDIEADTRRIALISGIGRETARTALHRLAADGWIRRLRDAAGVHGATWTIDPQLVFHKEVDTTRSQAATRPEGAGGAERILLRHQLQERLALSAHDLFTGKHALPLAAGNLYARLHSAAARDGRHTVLLQRLAQHRVITLQDGHWQRTGDQSRDAAARYLCVDGRLVDRKNRYRAERAVWAWWQAEHEWMRSPHPRRDRRPEPHQALLWKPLGVTAYPKHPRDAGGRADWRAARQAFERGALQSVTDLIAA